MRNEQINALSTVELVMADTEYPREEYQPLAPDWQKVQDGEQVGSSRDFTSVEVSRAFGFAVAANVAFDIANDPSTSAEAREAAEADLGDSLMLTDKNSIMSSNSSPFARNTVEWRNMRRNVSGVAGSETPLKDVYLDAETTARLQLDPTEYKRLMEQEAEAARRLGDAVADLTDNHSAYL